MNIWIFDDQYGKKIYEEINSTFDGVVFPIKKNIASPIPFLDKIKNGDIILLDNYFPGKQWEEPLGDEFLEQYLKRGLTCKIICISDYGKVLLDKYFSWEIVDKKGDIIGYVSSKEPEEILNLLKPIID